MNQITPQQEYNAAMDSVRLLNAGQPTGMSNADWYDMFQRNVEHLQIQITKGAAYFGALDLTPFENATALPVPPKA